MGDGLDRRRPRGPAFRAARPLVVEMSVDRSGVIVSVSDTCEDLLGWRSEDLIGTPLTRIIPVRYHEAHRAGFSRFVQTGELPLEDQVLALPAVHAVVGEIDIELQLRRETSVGDAVVTATLVAERDASQPAQSELTRVVQQGVSAKLPLAELLRNCVEVAARQHGWEAAAVWWVDPWLERLRVMAIWEAVPGAFPNYVANTESAMFRPGEGLVGSVWSTGAPIFQPDLTAVHMVRDRSMVRDGLRRGLFFPLIAGDETVGVVEMLDHQVQDFTVEDQEAVWVLADELGRLVADRLRREQETVHHQRVQTALTAGRMGVWSYHLETGLVTWDEELELMYGIEPGSFGGSFDDYAAKVHDEDREAVVGRIMEAMDRGERFEYQYRALRGDGSIAWLQGAGAPVFDTEGSLKALTGVCFDVTDRVEAQQLLDEQARHAALAADVGRALVGVDPVEERLAQTVAAVVDRLDAAFARIWTLEPGEDVLRLQASAGLYTNLDGDHSTIRVGDFKIGAIAAQREPHLTNNVLSDDMISDPAWAEREGMVSFAGYPLVVGEQLVGVLALFARRPLPDSTLAALASVADTVALAILQSWAVTELRSMIDESLDHAAAMERAMRDRAHVAEVLQASLLPPSLPDVPGLNLEAFYQAGVEDVGGDFYDVLPLHGSWGFMIGDVCGRGPRAARLTALARHSLRTALLLDLGPSGALQTLNEGILTDETDHHFCTAICGTFVRQHDRFVFRLAVGGHPRPLLIGADGEVRPVGAKGPLIGFFPDPVYEDLPVTLEPGDTLVLFTDGVTEAKRTGELFGDDRLRSLLAELDDRSPKAVVAAIAQAIAAFADAATDDAAVLAIGVCTI